MNELIMDENRPSIIGDRALIKASQIISWILNPFSIPFLAFVVLFLFTYLNMMPSVYKIIVLAIIGSFTILMPAVTIVIFRKINKISVDELSRQRSKRFIPYILSIISYSFCLAMMHKLSIPWYMTGIILAALVVQIVCLLINFRWKLSEHMAGIGGVLGGIAAFSALFGYNPLWWLSLFILLAGVLGTARMILKHHTLGEVLCGFTVGFVCALLILHPISNTLIQLYLF